MDQALNRAGFGRRGGQVHLLVGTDKVSASAANNDTARKVSPDPSPQTLRVTSTGKHADSLLAPTRADEHDYLRARQADG